MICPTVSRIHSSSLDLSNAASFYSRIKSKATKVAAVVRWSRPLCIRLHPCDGGRASSIKPLGTTAQHSTAQHAPHHFDCSAKALLHPGSNPLQWEIVVVHQPARLYNPAD